MPDGLMKLLERRVLIVTGKGGTGKTTIAATIAFLAAGRGIDTVLVEASDSEGLADLAWGRSDPVPRGDGREPVEIAPHLFFLRIEPEVALTEYLELQLRVRAIVALVVRNPGFRSLLQAAPGWRELITLGKLWHLETRLEAGRPRWGLLVVDAPSTGHGLSFLSVPKIVVEMVRLGPLHRHSEAVQDLLTDPARTLVVPVATPEELPVRETFQLCERVRQLGLHTGPVIANGVEPQVDLDDPAEVLEMLEALPPPPADANLLAPDALRGALAHALRRTEIQRELLNRLTRESETPVLELPHLARGVHGPDDLRELAGRLGELLGEPL